MTIGSNTSKLLCRQSIIEPEHGIEIWYCLISDLMDIVFLKKNYSTSSLQRGIFFEENDFIPGFLSPEELETINGFKALKKQIEWAAGRFLIKNMVNELFWKAYVNSSDIPFDHEKFSISSLDDKDDDKDLRLCDIIISHHEQGAPFLEKWPFVKISISHSGEYAAASLCLAKGKDPGLDIEKIGPVPDSSFMKIAFTEKEIANMQHCPEDVFKRWTVKEAFLKYIKKGFNENLHKVEILDGQIFHHGDKVNVSVFSTIVGNKYALSMVS